MLNPVVPLVATTVPESPSKVSEFRVFTAMASAHDPLWKVFKTAALTTSNLFCFLSSPNQNLTRLAVLSCDRTTYEALKISKFTSLTSPS